MRKVSLLSLILVAGALVQEGTHRVLRVIDGDTIEVEYEGRPEKVRYIGIDSPETVDPRRLVEVYGLEASDANRQLLENQHVRIEFDVERRDRYGRLLAYVWVDDVFVNEWLVRNGYAQVATYPPNVKYADCFLNAQRLVREEGRGLWGLAGTASVEAPEPQPAQACCKMCRKGKACGNSCIARNKTCRQAPGCACDASTR